ncbi:CRISPR-associated protein Csn2-St [Companilactobacillus paralimentarius]|uniref:CRISPR-associated protein Csn2-St n=1 Tax=Companilactobacillus paralimentarius TaxID=83526 RepID=UPI00384A45F3
MTLKIELENQKFLDIDFDDAVYIAGINQKKIWEIYRSLYYYFNKNPKLVENIYGENKIELILNDESISEKNNDFYFINNRDSICEQMLYKKNSLLFELLNSLADDIEVSKSLERINDEHLKLEIVVQNLLNSYSDNLKVEFNDINYLDFLKNSLLVEYESEGINFPLEFMNTGLLLDEFLNFLEFKLKSSSKPVWIVLYCLDSFMSGYDKKRFINKIKILIDKYDLKLIYLGSNLDSGFIDENDLDKIVIADSEFHQLLPYEELLNSIKMHYPSEFNIEGKNFVDSISRVVPYVGTKENIFISNKDLVLLKVVNEILGYETSYDLDDQLLTDAETKYLKE